LVNLHHIEFLSKIIPLKYKFLDIEVKTEKAMNIVIVNGIIGA